MDLNLNTLKPRSCKLWNAVEPGCNRQLHIYLQVLGQCVQCSQFAVAYNHCDCAEMMVSSGAKLAEGVGTSSNRTTRIRKTAMSSIYVITKSNPKKPKNVFSTIMFTVRTKDSKTFTSSTAVQIAVELCASFFKISVVVSPVSLPVGT